MKEPVHTRVSEESDNVADATNKTIDTAQSDIADTVNDDKMAEQSCSTELEACKAELATCKNNFLRTRADLENLSRRMEKERLQFVSVGQRAVLLDLLSVVDDFDRALAEHSAQPQFLQTPEEKHAETDVAQDRQVWLAGFALIRSGLYKMLEKYGVKPMTAQQYAVFDPHLHEAIMQIKSETHQSGEIVQVLLAGFMFGDQVLRPAQVSVAQ